MAIVLIVATVVAAELNQAFAQNQVVPGGGTNIVVRGGRSYGGGMFPYGGMGGFGGYGGGWGMAGTAQSAAEFGLASVIASSGYANMMNSQAAQGYEAARTQDINNRVLWTNSYYQMRQAHRAYIADHSRLSMDEVTKIAQDAAPKRLDATQLDPITGKINWPVILRDARYADICDEIDSLFKSRANASGFINADSYMEISRDCDRLLTLLKSNIDDYSANDFEKARHFVDSLRHETHFAGG